MERWFENESWRESVSQGTQSQILRFDTQLKIKKI